MDGSDPTIARDANGRFRPGCSGNPAGKKPGTRNRATLLREALREGEATDVARVVIDRALAGDAVAARFLLERLEPKPRGRPIQLDLPEGESAAGDVVALFNSALRALASGEITPSEAVEVSRFLEGRYRVLRAWQLEEKLTRWRDCLPVPGDRFVPEGVAERMVDPVRRQCPSSTLAPSSSSPLGERIEVRGSRRVVMPQADIAPVAAPPLPTLSPRGEGFAIPDDLAIAVRDRILAIPGVREIAQELALLSQSDLHSACISGKALHPSPAERTGAAATVF